MIAKFCARRRDLTLIGYVPYDWWTEADPRVSSILRNATASYRHELLLDNVSGIPLFEQHGSADDNVPVFHSRRMSQLIYQSDPSSIASQYGELPDKGHWFEGIMTTTQLRMFYQEVLDHPFLKEMPPAGFAIVVANPADMGSKYGVVVDQKVQPDQLGKVNVRAAKGTRMEVSIWEIETSNILRFHIKREALGELHPGLGLFDGDEVRLPSEESCGFGFYRSEDSTWIVCLKYQYP